MIIAFVPLRGGSKSIPLKNIKNFCGKPLAYWNLKALQDSKVDEIIVATDSDEIKRVVESFSFSKVRIYERDPKNAQDHSSTESVMLEFLHFLKQTHKASLYSCRRPLLSRRQAILTMPLGSLHKVEQIVSYLV